MSALTPVCVRRGGWGLVDSFGTWSVSSVAKADAISEAKIMRKDIPNQNLRLSPF